MNYFNIGICDDEKIILEKISQLINDKFKEINCDYNINKFLAPMEIIEYHSQEYFDIVFLDIDMPKINGIEAAQNIKVKNPDTIIIFITSKDELVYESLKVQPFRFIRKSKLTEEISEAIIEVNRFLENNSYKIKIITDKKKYEIDIKSILYIESSRNYITINTVNDNHYKYKDSINKKEHELEDYGFIRTHSGYLVNERYIQRLNKDNVIMKNNQKIPISRSRIQYVQQKLIEALR
ncbi:DNA-binding LytR/AlgR family response regulator [Sedimentibacter acidaminivorans]|uniref:DNA-binding LytR/AlgR family response regulator n=1 Tax=Sedimentibacter acidaminivorans TaxID=913099 RepID=A0ABS4GGE5_9FIRM|nr:LytTR family DNA-binding domain-containing protein [Sedimentibacter acidaminivorans]MBP1926746.1 DNA-binding LytR/AlgR family response regulator [Sedimentibacter acidaminivorans]